MKRLNIVFRLATLAVIILDFVFIVPCYSEIGMIGKVIYSEGPRDMQATEQDKDSKYESESGSREISIDTLFNSVFADTTDQAIDFMEQILKNSSNRNVARYTYVGRDGLMIESGISRISNDDDIYYDLDFAGTPVTVVNALKGEPYTACAADVSSNGFMLKVMDKDGNYIYDDTIYVFWISIYPREYQSSDGLFIEGDWSHVSSGDYIYYDLNFPDTPVTLTNAQYAGTPYITAPINITPDEFALTVMNHNGTYIYNDDIYVCWISIYPLEYESGDGLFIEGGRSHVSSGDYIYYNLNFPDIPRTVTNAQYGGEPYITGPANVASNRFMFSVMDHSGTYIFDDNIYTFWIAVYPEEYQGGGSESDLRLSNNTIPYPVPSEGGNYSVRVNNDGDQTLSWSTQNVPSWVTLTPSSGTVSGGDYQTLQIIVAQNNNTSSRDCSIKFVNDDNSSDYEYLQIYQAGKDNKPPVIDSVWAYYKDGSEVSNGEGFLLEDLDLDNTYTVSVTGGGVDQVRFIFGDSTKIDNYGTNGWSMKFNCVGLDPGDSLVIQAHNSIGWGPQVVFHPDIVGNPSWMAEYLAYCKMNIGEYVKYSVGTSGTPQNFGNQWYFKAEVDFSKGSPDNPNESPVSPDVPGGVDVEDLGGDYGYSGGIGSSIKVWSDRTVEVEGKFEAGVKARNLASAKVYATLHGTIVVADSIEWHGMYIILGGEAEIPVLYIPLSVCGIGVEAGIKIVPGISVKFDLEPVGWSSGLPIVPGLGIAISDDSGLDCSVSCAVKAWLELGFVIGEFYCEAGGKGVLTFQTPPDPTLGYFKDFALSAWIGGYIRFLLWTAEGWWQYEWVWSEQQGKKYLTLAGIARPDMRLLGSKSGRTYTDSSWYLISRDYVYPDTGAYNNFIWDTPGNNVKVIENVFPYAQPVATHNPNVSKGNEVLLVWAHDPETKPQVNGMELCYTYWNDLGYMDIPQTIPGTNDNKLQMGAQLAYDKDGDAICVFMQTNSTITEFSTVYEAYDATEIAYTICDHDTGWSGDIITLTNNSQMDVEPRIASNTSGDIVLVWSNDSDKDHQTIAGRSLYVSFWDGSSWSAPEKIVDSYTIVSGPNVAISESGDAICVFSSDDDDDPLTTTDQNIFYLEYKSGSWGSIHQFTTDYSFQDLLPSAVYDNAGDAYIIWLKHKWYTIGNDSIYDGNLYYKQVGSPKSGATRIINGPIYDPTAFQPQSAAAKTAAKDEGADFAVGWKVGPYSNVLQYVMINTSQQSKDVQPDSFYVSDNKLSEVSWCFAPGFITVATTERPTIPNSLRKMEKNCDLSFIYSGPLTNLPPDQPSTPTPMNGETDVDRHTDLFWSAGDPNASDSVIYDIYFGTTPDPPLYYTTDPYPAIVTGISYNGLPALASLTTYYWKIVAHDDHGYTAAGPEWSFTTEEYVPAPWWDANWSYRKELAVLNACADYQMLLTVYKEDGHDSLTAGVIDCEDHCNENFSDIRFVADDQVTKLPYWIEETCWDSSDHYARFWVRTFGDGSIYLYYGNLGALTTSDGDSTFSYFDHWITDNTGDWISGEPLADHYHWWENTTSFTTGRVLESVSQMRLWDCGDEDYTVMGWMVDRSSYWYNDDHVVVQWDMRESVGATDNVCPIRLVLYDGVTRTFGDYAFVSRPDPDHWLSLRLTYGIDRVSYEWKNLDTETVLASDEITDPGLIPSVNMVRCFFHDEFDIMDGKFNWHPPTYATVGNRPRGGGVEFRTDYWFIRNYCSPEPTWQTCYPEEKTNQPPYQPSNPEPTNGATDVPAYANLHWIGGDPDLGDVVTYDVCFGTTTPPPAVETGITDTCYNPEAMAYTTTYYWKITAHDDHGHTTEGPEWNFITQAYTPVAWWDTSWNYRKELTVSNACNNYQMSITVYKKDGHDSSAASAIDCDYHCNDDFSDIRFVADDQVTVLPYWIEETGADKGDHYAKVWVKTFGDGSIYMYYGNLGAETMSNGNNTFSYFDHWTTDNTGDWLSGEPLPDHYHWWENTTSFATGRALESVSKMNLWDAGGDYTVLGWMIDRSSYWYTHDHVVVQFDMRESQGATDNTCPIRLCLYDGVTRTFGEYTIVPKPDQNHRLYLRLTYAADKVTYELINLDRETVLASDEIMDPALIPSPDSVRYFFHDEYDYVDGNFHWLSPTYLIWGNRLLNGGVVFKTDYWFIRKYCTPEPSWDTWGPEEEPNQPPQPIDDLTIGLGGSYIQLWWTEPYADAGVTRYVVYRSTLPSTVGDSLAGTTNTTYTDTVVNPAGCPPVNYFYTVKAVDGAGQKSGESNKVGEFNRYLINELLVK